MNSYVKLSLLLVILLIAVVGVTYAIKPNLFRKAQSPYADSLVNKAKQNTIKLEEGREPLYGFVTESDGLLLTLSIATNETKDVVLTGDTYLAVPKDYPGYARVTGGYLKQNSVNILQEIRVGSEISIVGHVDEDGRFLVDTLHLLKQ